MVFFQNIPLFDRRNSAALDLVQPQQPPPVPNNHRAYNYFFQKAVPMIYAPFAISVMIPFFCFYTYFSVDPPNYSGFWFPLISDIGALDSQISFFSISICLIALLFLTTVFVRSAIVYRQLFIRQYKAENENLNLKYWFFLNNISLFLGFFATIGLIMVGVYPSSTCFAKHMIGVGICFPLIWVYIAFSTLIIYKLYRLNVESSPIWMVIFALISLFCLVVFAITFTLSACDATFEKFFDYEYRLYWTDDMPGFLMHRTSVFFEWFSLFSIVPFFLSIFHRSRVEIYKTYQLYLNVYV